MAISATKLVTTKFFPSTVAKYLSTAALLEFLSFFQTSTSQLATAPTAKLPSGSGISFPGSISVLASPAPWLVYLPTLSTLAPARSETDGNNAPFLTRMSFFAISISCN